MGIKNRSTVIVDFDDTLFDCAAFKDELASGTPVARAVAQCRRHMFPDAEDFLGRLSAAGFSVILLSRGEPAFQWSKIRSCSVAFLCHDVIVGSEDKIELVRPLLARGETAFLINDKIDETESVAAAYPTVCPILKRRTDEPAERYALHPFPSFATLTEIATYVIARKEQSE